MATTASSQDAQRLYRVDRFKVPGSARGEFIARVRDTHALLRTLPGFVEDFVLDRTDGSGDFNVVTVVVWESGEALEAAKRAVVAKRQEQGFNPSEMFARLGIEADLGIFTQVPARPIPE